MATYTVGAVERFAYTRAEAAEALRVSVPTIDRWIKQGLLHPCRASRRVVISRGELERFLDESSKCILLESAVRHG
jgi:excisionase family DNA binding protein